MKKIRVLCLTKGFILGFFAVFSPLVMSAPPQLFALRSNSLNDRVQIILDMNAKPNVHFNLEKNPLRLNVDITAIPAQTYKNLLAFRNRGIIRLRTSMRDKQTIRLAIELKNQFPYNVYTKSKTDLKPERVIIDIYDNVSNPQQVQTDIIQSHRPKSQHAESTGTSQQGIVKNTSPELSSKPDIPPTYRIINATDLVNSPTVKKTPTEKPNGLVKVSLTSTEVLTAQQSQIKPNSTLALSKQAYKNQKSTVSNTDVKKQRTTNKLEWETTATTSKNNSRNAALIVPDSPIDNHHIKRKQMMVVIDPGHGGKDGGAVGAHGTREKDVVLQIAKRLRRRINAMPNMRAELTRTTDRYISLRERTRIARKKKADLFISIHADAFTRRDVQGSSVFILSTRGASSEAARQLARRENAVDLKYGVDFKDYDPDISKVLMDIQQSATIESSYVLARKTLGQLKGIGKVHKRYVERAGFAVLKSPDIPSMLVETAFISNPSEERKLKSPAYQERIANAIAQGVKRYFAENLPHHILLGQSNN